MAFCEHKMGIMQHALKMHKFPHCLNIENESLGVFLCAFTYAHTGHLKVNIKVK